MPSFKPRLAIFNELNKPDYMKDDNERFSFYKDLTIIRQVAFYFKEMENLSKEERALGCVYITANAEQLRVVLLRDNNKRIIEERIFGASFEIPETHVYVQKNHIRRLPNESVDDYGARCKRSGSMYDTSRYGRTLFFKSTKN